MPDGTRRVHPLIEFAVAHAGAGNRDAFVDAVYRIWGRLALVQEETRLARMADPDDHAKRLAEVESAVEFFVFSQLIETGDSVVEDVVEKMVADAEAGEPSGDPTSARIMDIVRSTAPDDTGGMKN